MNGYRWNDVFKDEFVNFDSSAYGYNPFTDFFQSQGLGLSKEEKQLLKQIKEDAMEYYSGVFHVDMNQSYIREHLSKDQKERVAGFMKERLKWYNENGFLLS